MPLESCCCYTVNMRYEGWKLLMESELLPQELHFLLVYKLGKTTEHSSTQL